MQPYLYKSEKQLKTTTKKNFNIKKKIAGAGLVFTSPTENSGLQSFNQGRLEGGVNTSNGPAITAKLGPRTESGLTTEGVLPPEQCCRRQAVTDRNEEWLSNTAKEITDTKLYSMHCSINGIA